MPEAPSPAGTRPPTQPQPGPGRKTSFDVFSQARPVRWLLGTRLCRLALAPARGDSAFNRFVRYSLVSAVAIVISQVTILVCTWLFHLSGIASNTIGALAATPASYELNRKWAWGKSGKSHLWREVVPFWSLSLTGFLASTGTVELADNFCHSHHIVGLDRSLVIMGASLFAYGVIWVVKFLVFNRLFDPGGAPAFAHRQLDGAGSKGARVAQGRQTGADRQTGASPDGTSPATVPGNDATVGPGPDGPEMAPLTTATSSRR